MLLLGLVASTTPSLAHVEEQMPDSVAEMEYRILLEFRPHKFETRVKLAFVLMNQNKLEEAEKEFNLSLLAAPQNLQAHLGLSLLRLKQQRTTEALEIIKKAEEIEPDNPAVYLNYGLILEADNRPREARQRYRDGLAKLVRNQEDPEVEHDRQQLENALQKLEDKLTKIAPAN